MRIVKSMLLAVPALLIASLSSSPSYAAASDRISGALTKSGGQTVVLRGNVRHQAKSQFDQGAVDPAMHLGTMTLLTVPTAAQQKALTQLLAQQQDRKSPNYHKWLTPEQFADRFGLSSNDMQKMADWLQSQGFTRIQQARGRNWISFTGTALQVESAFATEIHHYNVEGKLHYANATAPSIPVVLSGIVGGVRGLDDFHPKPMGIQHHPNYFYNGEFAAQFVSPGDVYTIYDVNALYTNGIDGTGQKLAVMGETDIYQSDINNFRTGFGLSSISCTTQAAAPNDVITSCSDPHFSYVLDGADPGVSSGDLSESDLDLEWSGAVATGAQLVFVNSTDVYTSFYYAIDQNLAPVISLSYGGCEFMENIYQANGLGPLFETELMQANTEGITFVNSAGDTGSAACDSNNPGGSLTGTGLATLGLAVSYPASSPEVTAVGGTAIPLADISPTYWGTTNATNGGTALSYIPEQAWNDDDEFVTYCQQNPGTFCENGNDTPGWVPIISEATAQEDIGIGTGGGGASNCANQTADFSECVSGFTQPTWQTVTISGQTTRMVPDVSFLATPNFPGYIFCTQLSELDDSGSGSSCNPGGAAGITDALGLRNISVIGGTSVSAPVFAGMVTLLNQYLADGTSPGLGNVNSTLYTLAATPANGAFNQVLVGDNFVACEGGDPTDQPVALQCPSTGPSAGVIGYEASDSDAATGFNLVTGLGSVNVNHLAAAWAASLPAGFSLAPTAMSYQVTQGSPVDVTVTVQLNGGFAGTVSFQCSDAAPASTCTAPPSVNATGKVSFNITTTAPTAALNHPPARATGIFYAALLPGLLGILFTAGSRRRSLHGLRLLGLIIAMGFTTLWMTSCGGGSSGNTSNPGTPPGNYIITVTATSGASAPVTSTFQLDVVQ
jgi:subtilase family serine protease